MRGGELLFDQLDYSRFQLVHHGFETLPTVGARGSGGDGGQRGTGKHGSSRVIGDTTGARASTGVFEGQILVFAEAKIDEARTRAVNRHRNSLRAKQDCAAPL